MKYRPLNPFRGILFFTVNEEFFVHLHHWPPGDHSGPYGNLELAIAARDHFETRRFRNSTNAPHGAQINA